MEQDRSRVSVDFSPSTVSTEFFLATTNGHWIKSEIYHKLERRIDKTFGHESEWMYQREYLLGNGEEICTLFDTPADGDSSQAKQSKVRLLEASKFWDEKRTKRDTRSRVSRIRITSEEAMQLHGFK
jgi:hypothetical protein